MTKICCKWGESEQQWLRNRAETTKESDDGVCRRFAQKSGVRMCDSQIFPVAKVTYQLPLID